MTHYNNTSTSTLLLFCALTVSHGLHCMEITSLNHIAQGVEKTKEAVDHYNPNQFIRNFDKIKHDASAVNAVSPYVSEKLEKVTHDYRVNQYVCPALLLGTSLAIIFTIMHNAREIPIRLLQEEEFENLSPAYRATLIDCKQGNHSKYLAFALLLMNIGGFILAHPHNKLLKKNIKTLRAMQEKINNASAQLKKDARVAQ